MPAYLRRIGVHVRILSALVDDLFELTRIETGEITWSMSRVRLDALVPEAVDALRTEASAKGVEMRCDVPAGLDPVQADAARLQRVLFNLIQNAIRHTPADGSVVVLAERVGPRLEVEVADSGTGIAAGRPRARVRAVRAGRGPGRARRRRRARARDRPRDRRGARQATSGSRTPRSEPRVRFSLQPA